MKQEPSFIESDESLDRISSLPDPITGHILGMMPLKDAVRTSILSRNWRFNWSKSSTLEFDSNLLTLSGKPDTERKVVRIINQVLIIHNSPITKFKLSHKDLTAVCDIDAWIVYLSRRSVWEFVLKIWKGQKYLLPSSLFLFPSLGYLKLRNCVLRPPPYFRGFPLLKNLVLCSVTIAQDALAHLISSCHILERLTLSNVDWNFDLNVCAPQLQFFEASGNLNKIRFQNASKLSVVSISSTVKARARSLALRRPSRLIWSVDDLPNIRRLELKNCSSMFLGTVPLMPFVHLVHISLSINFGNHEEKTDALQLLRCAPNLQELEIESVTGKGRGGKPRDIWWAKYLKYSQLRTVEIDDIRGVTSELNFIESILSNSPVLETVTMTPAAGEWTSDLTTELIRFRRASPKAEIILVES